MNFWSDCRLAIIVDAISADKPAGEIFEINNADFLEADPGLLSSHGGGIVEAWKLSEAIGSLPQKLIVFGIVGKNFNSGTEICHAVQAAGEQLVERITQRLEEELVQDA